MTAASTPRRALQRFALLVAFALPALAPLPAVGQVGTLQITVRRATAFGLPQGSTHHSGITGIVSGRAQPGSAVTVALVTPGGEPVTRGTVADKADGAFLVNLDRPITAGDRVTVADGNETRTVGIPRLEAVLDAATNRAAGWGPRGISLGTVGAPQTLAIGYSGTMLPVQTDAQGFFSADFTKTVDVMPGLPGQLSYVTPAGDAINAPVMPGWPFVRGVAGDGWADVVLGQPDFSQITPNEVVAKRMFNPAGILVDRGSRPNRVYVWDGGNNRVLGLSSLGRCSAGRQQGEACTMDSDCSAATCAIDPERPADLVFGQPDFNHSACNGDNGWQQYPDVAVAGADTLCGLREEQMSISEGGSGASMAVDGAGNLYVPDHFNNRVLRYDRPFETDTVADAVWGQADFHGITCNLGHGSYRPQLRGLCLGPPPGLGNAMAGVDVDAAGNLWVADMVNNRVLRFPVDTALGRPGDMPDLVLGQRDFSTWSGNGGLDRPSAVRVSATGTVYVVNWGSGRLVAFDPPFTSGMAVSRTLDTSLRNPSGLGMGPTGELWVADATNQRYLRFVDERLDQTVYGYMWGGLGVDGDANLFAAGWIGQSAVRFAAPAHTADTPFLGHGWRDRTFNQVGSRGIGWGYGIEVTDEQLILGDGYRLRYWNEPAALTTFQPADGAVTAPDTPTPRDGAAEFLRMRADAQGWLWVVRSSGGTEVDAYALPLQSGARPVRVLRSPLPLAGGGSFTWTPALLLSGVAVQPGCDCLWLSDSDSNRTFRVRDAHSQPVVDVVLGQANAGERACNRGRQSPAADTLCAPGGLSFDPAGNLYVSDHNLEFNGNHRLLMFAAEQLAPAFQPAVFGLAAQRVLGRGGDFTRLACLPRDQDPLCGPFEPGFDTDGRMALGLNGYTGLRFPLLYRDPRADALPYAALGDFYSMPTTSRFDRPGNLYVLDHNRGRVMIYKGPLGEVTLPSPAVPVATATPTPTTSPVPPSVTPTQAPALRIWLPALLR